MKTRLTIAACVLIGFTAYGQRPKSNPALDTLNSIKDPKVLDQKLKMLGSGSEEDLGLLLTYYRKSEKSSDSVAQLALKKFPKGKIAFGLKSGKVYSEKDALAQEKYLLQLKKEFPDEDYDQLNFMLAYNFANAKYAAKALEYLAQTKGKSRSVALATIPGIVMDYDLKAAEMTVDKELAVQKISTEDRLALLNIYSQIMDKKGNAVKAFAAVKEFYEKTDRKSPELTAYYYYLMSKTGAYAAAFPELEKAIIDGLGNENMQSALKIAFVKLNPGKSAEAYMASLNKQLEDKNRKELVAKMITEQSPNFKVKDIAGNEVALSDFAGKIVVLDFWATWCGPCKRALPSMQLTVNKYKNDPNVKFLFIHTWERVADPKADAIKYLADNKFNLPLYMDLKDLNTKQNPAVSAFGVDGIPAKFVIDGKGRIRFKMSGFGGSDDSAVAELSAMIELSRQAI